MNCHVRTIERCYTYLLEIAMYKKSITITTQSGLQTLVYTMTITSPHRVIPYIAIIRRVVNASRCVQIVRRIHRFFTAHENHNP